MKRFLLGIAGVFVLSGTVLAQCWSGSCVQQQAVQYQYVQPVQKVQRVVQFVEVPKVRIVEKVRVQPQVQYKVQKQVVKQRVKVVQPVVQKVVKQKVVKRQPLLQRLRSRNVRVERVRVVNQY